MKFIEFTDSYGNPVCVNSAAITYVDKNPDDKTAVIYFINGEKLLLSDSYDWVVGWLKCKATEK